MQATKSSGIAQSPEVSEIPLRSYIGVGEYSRAYREGDTFIRVFHEQGITLDGLREYYALNTKARQAANDESFRGTITLAGEQYTYEFGVAPIMEVFTDPSTGSPSFRCPFVGGPSAFNMLKPGHPLFHTQVKEVTDLQERERLEELHQKVTDDRKNEKGVDITKIYGLLQKAGYMLTQTTGDGRIHVTGSGVKVSLDQNKHLKFTITDLTTDFLLFA